MIRLALRTTEQKSSTLSNYLPTDLSLPACLPAWRRGRANWTWQQGPRMDVPYGKTCPARQTHASMMCRSMLRHGCIHSRYRYFLATGSERGGAPSRPIHARASNTGNSTRPRLALALSPPLATSLRLSLSMQTALLLSAFPLSSRGFCIRLPAERKS